MAGPLKFAGRKKQIKFSTKKIGVVVSAWNPEITESLYDGASNALLKMGFRKNNLFRRNVPGSFELPLAAQRMVMQKSIDGVICLGCVIQGETPHFDYICQAVAQGIMAVNLKYTKPVIFGVLTTLNKKQAMDRAGGKFGNKGEEAAATLAELLTR